jgi:carboxypeptidase T
MKQRPGGAFVDVHSYGEVLIWPWGHGNKATGNRDYVEAMVHKITHFSGYDLSGPGFGYAYPASVATDDWAYGTLGVAGMTWELGTDFHQDCSYFENHVLPDNLPALTYLASLAYAPYPMSKGPDILSLSVDVTVPNGQQQPVVSLQVTASDAAYSSLPTAQQAVTEVRVILDVHPNQSLDGNPPQYLQLELLPSGSDSGTITGSLSITVQDFLGSSSSPNNAGDRRSIYVQAIDSDGYSGPVAAVWLDQTDVGEGGCSEGELDFDFTITTDNYGFDTSWSLVNSQGESVLSGGSYKNDSSYNERQCLPHDAYTLAISCAWWLCYRVEVASTCPSTCQACTFFS